LRLDIFLKRTNLVKRRTQAQELIAKGQVHLNDSPAKAGKSCQAGHKIQITLPNRSLLIEILELPSRNFSAQAGSIFYKVLEERKIDSGFSWD